jgi:hypothetical protein
MATEGTRNATLNTAALKLGRLVAGGELDEQTAVDALMHAAARAGLGDAEARKTIQSGLGRGMQEPRAAPNSTQGINSPISPSSPSDEWNPELSKWPVLSAEAMPGIVGEFIELATKDSEADPAAVLATFLARFGAEVRGQERNRGPVHYVGETRHFPRLFCAIVGASSKSRKGTSASPVKRLFQFEEAEHGLYIPATCSRGPLSTGEGLAFAVRDEGKEWQVDKRTKTGEWLTTDPGVTDKRLFVLDEELAAALACTKREGNTLSVAIRSFWDDGSYSPMTKKERTKCTDAHVNIVTHITLAELKHMLDETNSLNGFANRFLWVCSRRSKLVARPKRLEKHALAYIQRELLALMRNAQAVGVMRMEQDALALWDEVYPELSADNPGLRGCVINRGEAQAIRLAMIYALLDGKEHIGADHLRAALAFWAY